MINKKKLNTFMKPEKTRVLETRPPVISGNP